MSRRAVYVDTGHTISGGAALWGNPVDALGPTPADAFDGGLVGLLGKLAPGYGPDGGVLLLSGPAAQACGLPVECDRLDEDGPIVLAELARAGWRCERWSDWSTVRGPKDAGVPTVYVATVPLMDLRPDQTPLWGAAPIDAVARMTLWHELMGTPWRMGPGASALATMAALDRARCDRNPRAIEVSWKPRPSKQDRTIRPEPGPEHGFEDPYRADHWTAPRPEHPPGFVHCYDANRAYIGAAMSAPVAPWLLKHTGRRTGYAPTLAGWWLVELAGWSDPRMPDPAGYVLDEDGKQRIVRAITAPTLGLLEELTAKGFYAGVRVLDSWTGPARDFPIKPLAERLRDAYKLIPAGGTAPLSNVDDQDVESVRRALKIAGHKVFGLIADPGNWVYRPHWWDSLVAQDRCNRWRRAWRIGQQEGRWPMRFDADQIWYGSDEEDPDKAAPRGLRPPLGPNCRQYRDDDPVLDPTGLKLGAYKHKSTRRLKMSPKPR